jgi:hypothetical protein
MKADDAADYFHVNRRVGWSPFKLLSTGETIDIGGVSNPYFRFFEEHQRMYGLAAKDGAISQVAGVRFLAAVRAGDVNANDLAATAHDLATHLVGFLRELIWEDVRRREFPHVPSRQRCMWLIPSLEGVEYWRKRMDVTGDFPGSARSSSGTSSYRK